MTGLVTYLLYLYIVNMFKSCDGAFSQASGYNPGWWQRGCGCELSPTLAAVLGSFGWNLGGESLVASCS